MSRLFEGLQFWDHRAAMTLKAKMTSPSHPYYPLDSYIPGYAASSRGIIELLTLFALGCAAILSVTWFVLGKTSARLPTKEKTIVLWFILSGTIHAFFEGYFVWNHASMGSKQDLFGQLWKEYSLSDSRYLTSDSFTVCMECITAVLWGPLCYYVAYCVATSNPLQFPLQAIVSVGQIYGDILYFATSLFDLSHRGIQFFRPEPFYFYSYYVFMNAIWIVIPGILLWQSVARTRQAFAALHRMAITVDRNGRLRKPSANGHMNGHVKKP